MAESLTGLTPATTYTQLTHWGVDGPFDPTTPTTLHKGDGTATPISCNATDLFVNGGKVARDEDIRAYVDDLYGKVVGYNVQVNPSGGEAYDFAFSPSLLGMATGQKRYVRVTAYSAADRFFGEWATCLEASATGWKAGKFAEIHRVAGNIVVNLPTVIDWPNDSSFFVSVINNADSARIVNLAFRLLPDFPDSPP